MYTPIFFLPHGKYDIRGIAQAHKQKRRHFHAKTTSAKLYIYNGEGARDLYIDEAHTALNIFRFAAFLLFQIMLRLNGPTNIYLQTKDRYARCQIRPCRAIFFMEVVPKGHC